jgi:hypothetical protein
MQTFEIVVLLGVGALVVIQLATLNGIKTMGEDMGEIGLGW